VSKDTRKKNAPSQRSQSGIHPGIELRRLTLCLDWNRRSAIDHTLAQVRSKAASSPHAQHIVAAAVRDAIARSHEVLRGAVFQSWSLTQDQGQQAFRQCSTSLRMRGLPSPLATLGVGPVPAVPGNSYVCVTLVVATCCPLPALPSRMDVSSVLSVLESMVPPHPDLLVAFDVLWLPESRATAIPGNLLHAVVPECLALSNTPRTLLGCPVCKALRHAGMAQCPACGA
jgi:hypothetical protein